MKVIFLSNYFNHHQKPLADALFRILGNDYWFVETTGVPEFRKKLGYQEIKAPYVIKYSDLSSEKIGHMILDADVVIYGEAPLKLVKARYNAGKLTFRDDESRYKNPNRYLKWLVYTYKSFWLNKGFLLCASAYAPIDYMLSGMNPKKCYRWGYYTEVKRYDSVNELMRRKRIEAPLSVSILWAGRLIGLKHPESIIFVAEHLKKKNIKFTIDVIGAGNKEDDIKKKVKTKGLDDVIRLHGSMKPSEVRTFMEKSDIFLFTSDRREGWGAVLNEAMNSGCAVVADGNIGSVPYLINDGINGLIYKSTNWTDLCEKVEYLAIHSELRQEMGRKAYKTMTELWNGELVASRFVTLCEAILKNKNTPYNEGPCSQAPILMRRWKGQIKTL